MRNRTRPSSSMRRPSTSILSVGLWLIVTGLLPVASNAGPNAGGSLLVHALETTSYTTEHLYGYCAPLPDAFSRAEGQEPWIGSASWIDDCEEVDSSFPDAATPVAWVVFASFSQDNFPRLAGVEFGIEYSPALRIIDWGACADFESFTGNWPNSGAGTIVVWNDELTERLVPVYWFAGYAASAASEEGGGLHFSVTPHPLHGGHFADRSPAPVLDEIAHYGALGFGNPGNVPCPGAETYVVRADGSGDFPTIQDALSAAAPTSVIELEDGVYSGPGNRDLQFNYTAFTLRSISGDPERCVIDCGGTPAEHHRGVRFDPGTRPSRIEGIGFRNGFSGRQLGIATNRQGGAIRVGGGQLTISNCVFEDCGTDRTGGAIGGEGFPLVIEDCAFRRNHAVEGAAGALDISGASTLVLRRTEFTDNWVEQPLNGLDVGGAMRMVQGNLTMEDCLFQGNEAGRGGAVYLLLTHANLSGTTWRENRGGAGGALHMARNVVNIDHCTFAANSAGRGGSVYADIYPSILSIESSILAFGTEGEAIACGGARVFIRHTDIFGNKDGDWVDCLEPLLGEDENVQCDPLFCDLEGGVLGLDSRSRCAVKSSSEWPGVMGSQPVSCGPVEPRVLDVTSDGGEAASRSVGAGDATLDGIGDGAQPPGRFGFVQVSPNPAPGRISVRFRAPAPGAVELAVLDPSGRRVDTLVATSDGALGEFVATWDGRDARGQDVPSGVYFLRLACGGRNATERVSILR
ncbi:MAG: FlgD immunoglobulin-like domain containing protein [Candidatus Eisenbacteria bacterium]